MRTLLALLVSLPALADPPARVAVLGIEAAGAPDDVTQALTNALRTEFEHDGYVLTPPRDLAELKLVACNGSDDVACLSMAAKKMDAALLAYGTLSQAGSSRTLSLRLVDVASGKVVHDVHDKTVSDLTPASVTAEAAWLVEELTGHHVAKAAPPASAPAAGTPPAAAPPEPTAPVVIEQWDETSWRFRVGRVEYSIDGHKVFGAAEGAPNFRKRMEVFHGALPAGDHTLDVSVVVLGGRVLGLSYLNGFSVTLATRQTFKVSTGKQTTVTLVADDQGGLTTAWEQRPRLHGRVTTIAAK